MISWSLVAVFIGLAFFFQWQRRQVDRGGGRHGQSGLGRVAGRTGARLVKMWLKRR